MAGIRALAKSPHLSHVTDLDLSSNRIGPASARALAAAPLVCLRCLDLGYNPLGDAGVRWLAASPYLSTLTTLVLTAARLGNESARVLAASPHLAGLTSLILCGNDIRGPGKTVLRRRIGDRVHF
jgi:hypothetical protein